MIVLVGRRALARQVAGVREMDQLLQRTYGCYPLHAVSVL